MKSCDPNQLGYRREMVLITGGRNKGRKFRVGSVELRRELINTRRRRHYRIRKAVAQAVIKNKSNGTIEGFVQM